MSFRFEMLAGILIVCMILIACETNSKVEGAELGKESIGTLGRFENLFSRLKQTSRQGASYASDLLASIPFGKVALASGALLSIFFLFIRLIVVLGPILILGAMTRESTDATDLMRMLIEFFNQVIVSLDEQMAQSQPSGMAAAAAAETAPMEFQSS